MGGEQRGVAEEWGRNGRGGKKCGRERKEKSASENVNRKNEIQRERGRGVVEREEEL